MSLTQNIKGLRRDEVNVAFRAAQTYSSVTGAYTVFQVVDGAVEILTFGARVTAAAGGAVTVAGTFNGVAGDNGAVLINGAVGTVVYYPLNVGGAILNAAAIPKTVATLTTMIVGTQPAAAPGLIVLTFAVSTFTGEWFCVYRKLNPLARVI